MARQLSKKLIVYLVDEIKHHGFVKIDDGTLSIVTRKLNKDNFKMTEKFETQIKDERIDDTFITFISSKTGGQFNQDELPIYGNPDKYVTKFLGSQSIEESIMRFIQSTNSTVAKRIKQYKDLMEVENNG